MKRILFLLLSLTGFTCLQAQNVGIGTSSPNGSAMLEISSSSKGLLLPRVADTSAVAIPVKGLVIYNNTNNKLWYYDGSRWQQSAGNSGGMDSIWYKAKDSIAYTAKSYVGINTDLNLITPQANLQVTGSLLVQGKLGYSNATPTAGQTYTMNNTAAFQSVLTIDSVFRIYDPGGTGNYGNDMQGNVLVQLGACDGFKVSSVAADFGFGAGDTLWVGEAVFPECRTRYTYRFTNTLSNPEDFILGTASRYFIFRSNASGTNKGFNFKVTRLFNNEPVKTAPTAGTSLYFNTSNGSFWAGASSLARAPYATATGFQTLASGISSVAMGQSTAATANTSVALGRETTASGASATALGETTVASGQNSLATGYQSEASGFSSSALGRGNASGNTATAMGLTSATGDFSTSLGFHTEAQGYAGTVVGMYNFPILGGAQTGISPYTPLFIVGNGDGPGELNNALAVYKNGNVGIGTQLPPSTKLHIVGGSDADLSGNSGFLVIGDINSTNLVFDNNEIIARNSGANATLFLQNNGGAFEVGGDAAKPGGGSWAVASDARLKQNVSPYSEGLQQLLKVNPVYYQYNEQSGYDTKKQYVGVLAQELQAIAPYMVGSFTKNNVDYLNVDNSAMTYMLINAVKEQQRQIEELKALVNQLISNQTNSVKK
ncbi:MAG: tail fiber domain-containing protein [Bacteroidota bacterium]